MMNQILPQLNQNLSWGEEYSYLISLSVLSESEAERIAQILALANSDESLNFLIEEIEMNNYLKSKQINEESKSSFNENQGLRRLLKLISEDANNFENLV